MRRARSWPTSGEGAQARLALAQRDLGTLALCDVHARAASLQSPLKLLSRMTAPSLLLELNIAANQQLRSRRTNLSTLCSRCVR